MEKNNYIYTLNDGVRFLPEKHLLVSKKGVAIELTENSQRLLVLLFEGETDKQKLITAVWKEQMGAVSDSSYYGQLYLLRKAFKEVGLDECLIKTIPRKGVKYVGVLDKNFVEPDVIVTEVADDDLAADFPPFPLPNEEGRKAHKKKQSNKEVSWIKRIGAKLWDIGVGIFVLLSLAWLIALFVVLISKFFLLPNFS